MFSGELTEATAGMLSVLSVLRWERKVGRAALEKICPDQDSLAHEIDIAIEEQADEARNPEGPLFKTLPSGQRAIIVEMDSPLRALLNQAEQEALGLGHDWVGTEHLVLSAIRLACPRLQAVLGRQGITYDGVKAAVLELLRPPSSNAEDLA
jgi:hypothetical protein